MSIDEIIELMRNRLLDVQADIRELCDVTGSDGTVQSDMSKADTYCCGQIVQLKHEEIDLKNYIHLLGG